MSPSPAPRTPRRAPNRFQREMSPKRGGSQAVARRSAKSFSRIPCRSRAASRSVLAYASRSSSAKVTPGAQVALRLRQRFQRLVRSVMVLDPRTDPERFMRALAAAGNGSFIDATGGETMLASLLLAILKS